VKTLELIVGVERDSVTRNGSATSKELKARGHHWAQHVLEAPRSWILCAVYILVTVNLGLPIFTALAANGPHQDSMFLLGAALFADSIAYLFLPQLATLLLRALQHRPLFHRMAGRSVVIGDVPWVSQCAEAFASKLFACSYSNTTPSFYAANPADHLVHRLTHRVVRGGLLAVGRPDGRISGLSSQEASACLSVNQASSIQNFGVTLESLTIGANPSKLPLSAFAVYIPTNRPNFLCEKTLKDYSGEWDGTGKSANAIIGDYENIWKQSEKEQMEKEMEISEGKINRRRSSMNDKMRRLSRAGGKAIPPALRLGNIEPTREAYFGEELEKANQNVPVHVLIGQQRLSQRLYESRVGSMQRFVAFLVLFHQMGKAVQDFWGRVSLGLLAYDMDRTHSIMRIATTASPVSGAAIRGRMAALAMEAQWKTATGALSYLVNLRLYPEMKKRITSPRSGQQAEVEEERAVTYPEEWEHRVANLVLRFPKLKKNQVAKALVDKDGHAGKAIMMLNATMQDIEAGAAASEPGMPDAESQNARPGAPETTGSPLYDPMEANSSLSSEGGYSNGKAAGGGGTGNKAAGLHEQKITPRAGRSAWSLAAGPKQGARSESGSVTGSDSEGAMSSSLRGAAGPSLRPGRSTKTGKSAWARASTKSQNNNRTTNARISIGNNGDSDAFSFLRTER